MLRLIILARPASTKLAGGHLLGLHPNKELHTAGVF